MNRHTFGFPLAIPPAPGALPSCTSPGLRMLLTLLMAATAMSCDRSCPLGTQVKGALCARDTAVDVADAQAEYTQAQEASGLRMSEGGGAIAGAAAPSVSCTAGDRRCAASGKAVERCSGEGAWLEQEICNTSCAQGVCTGSCRAGAERCAPNQVQERCDDAGNWAMAQACMYACDQDECVGECRPGDRRCGGPDELTPETCDEHGQWLAQTACVGRCANGGCAGSCQPGERRCGLDERPELCSDQGIWEPTEACPYVCSGAGDCTGSCKPGERSCGGPAGLTPQLCGNSGMWLPAANDCTNICSSGSCGGSCVPESRRCGATGRPELCSAAGTWEPEPACAYVCSGDGACTGECEPGTRECSDATPRVCDLSGHWRYEASCQHLCSGEGRCTECLPETTECSGQTPRTCDSTGNWRNDPPCTNSICDGDTGTCRGDCAPGTTRCAGTTLQTCGVSGAWQSTQRCPGLCAGGECTGVCVPGERTCSDNTQRTCNATGTDYVVQACEPAQVGETAGCRNGACSSACEKTPGRCDGSAKCWDLRYGCEQCVDGYIWRSLYSGDRVCVTRAAQQQAQKEDAERAQYVTTDPEKIAQHGPEWCMKGYVWRDAYDGDRVCVEPASRDRAARENAEHRSHTRVGADP